MMIVLIDNYDSFTYNLFQYIGMIEPEIEVIRNDQLTVKEIFLKKPTHIIISPGPGRPNQAGICEELILQASGKIPILGICLGHQGIGEAFGGVIEYAKELRHGKESHIHIANGSPIFRGLSPVIQVARYHSLMIERKTLPDEILVIAEDQEGEIMGIKHRDYETYGLQFHPESILTPDGNIMIENFIQNISYGKEREVRI